MPSRSQPRRIDASIAAQIARTRARTSASGRTAHSLRRTIVEIDSPWSSAIARSSSPVANRYGGSVRAGAPSGTPSAPTTKPPPIE
jgi:hypothetical protein